MGLSRDGTANSSEGASDRQPLTQPPPQQQPLRAPPAAQSSGEIGTAVGVGASASAAAAGAGAAGGASSGGTVVIGGGSVREFSATLRHSGDGQFYVKIVRSRDGTFRIEKVDYSPPGGRPSPPCLAFSNRRERVPCEEPS